MTDGEITVSMPVRIIRIGAHEGQVGTVIALGEVSRSVLVHFADGTEVRYFTYEVEEAPE